MWNGVREYVTAGQSVVTGCTVHPSPDGTYYSLHEGEETPVADHISTRTRKILHDYRESTKSSEKAKDYQIFIIESILEVSEENGKKMFKVKWFNYLEEQATLEPIENIPKFIQEYYKDKTKLGQKLPNPRIKHTKKLADGRSYHFLYWEGGKGGSWLKEDFFKMAGADDEEDSILPSLICGTRKSRDKRICR
jgi:hypothetical protein